jgi:hypothetical protein
MGAGPPGRADVLAAASVTLSTLVNRLAISAVSLAPVRTISCTGIPVPR